MAIFNSTAPCPYCYAEINPKKLAYRCSGRNGADSRRCAKVPDSVRQQYFADFDPYWPVIMPIGSASASCHSCGAAAGQPICPACHSALPTEFSSEVLLIGVVGASNAGKTTLLAALDFELRTVVADRFEASVRPQNTEGNRVLSMYWSFMHERGQLPPVTAPVDRCSPVIYSWRASAGRRIKTALIAFCDRYGNYFAHEEAAELSYAASSTELLFLIDPFDFEADFAARKARGTAGDLPGDLNLRILHNIAQRVRHSRGVRSNKQIDVPVACVVGKVDAFDDAASVVAKPSDVSSSPGGFDDVDSRRISDGIRALVVAWGGERFIRALETEFSTVRYFGVSALGAEPTRSDKGFSVGAVQAIKIAEPLLWFMARRRLVPSGPLSRRLRESA